MAARDFFDPASAVASLALDRLHDSLRRQQDERLTRQGFATVLRAFGATADGGLMAWCGNLERSRSATADRLLPIVRSAATVTEVWQGADARALARTYLGALAEADALEALRQTAIVVPAGLTRVMVATGAEVFEAPEGLPKAVVSYEFNDAPLEPHKVAGIVVGSQELFASADPEVSRLFELELRKSVVAAGNRAVLDALPPGNVAAGGATATADLAAAMAAAADDDAYLILGSRTFVRRLAVEAEGRIGPAGGQFAPGIRVIALAQDSSVPAVTAIPATRVRLHDFGFQVRHAGHATLDMAPTPTSPSEQVSMFQANSRAIVVERLVRLEINGTPGIVA